jgi:hypothetical protein
MNMEHADDMLADTIARKTEVVIGQKDKIKLKLDKLEARLKKLADIQQKRKLEAAEDFVMTKAGINQKTAEINSLQDKIQRAFTQKTLSEKELDELEVRLKSLEAILPSENNQKN